MKLPEDGYLLRIFVGESDRHEGKPLYEWLVRKAREEGLAGATVLRGIEGFGAHSRLHTAKILRLSEDLPIIIEIVDALEKIEAFMPIVDGVIAEGYQGGRNSSVQQLLMKPLRAKFLSLEEHRRWFAGAGFSDVQVFEEQGRGWMCATGRKPAASAGSPGAGGV